MGEKKRRVNYHTITVGPVDSVSVTAVVQRLQCN